MKNPAPPSGVFVLGSNFCSAVPNQLGCFPFLNPTNKKGYFHHCRKKSNRVFSKKA
jgi:hypothetical protein